MLTSIGNDFAEHQELAKPYFPQGNIRNSFEKLLLIVTTSRAARYRFLT